MLMSGLLQETPSNKTSRMTLRFSSAQARRNRVSIVQARLQTCVQVFQQYGEVHCLGSLPRLCRIWNPGSLLGTENDGTSIATSCERHLSAPSTYQCVPPVLTLLPLPVELTISYHLKLARQTTVHIGQSS